MTEDVDRMAALIEHADRQTKALESIRGILLVWLTAAAVVLAIVVIVYVSS